MQPYGEAGAGAAYGGLDWGFIGRTAALVFATVTIALVVVVASLPWWDTGTFAYPLGNPFCHEQACGDYTDSASLRNVFPPTYGLVTMAFALSIFELVVLVGSITSYWNRVGILVTGIPGSIVSARRTDLLLLPVPHEQLLRISRFGVVHGLCCRRILHRRNHSGFLWCRAHQARRKRASVPVLRRCCLRAGECD